MRSSKRITMSKQPHYQSDTRPGRARFVLIAWISWGALAPAAGADLPVSVLDVGSSAVNGTIPGVPLIPADNPIGAILLSKQHVLLSRGDFSRVSDLVTQIYQTANFQPIWFNAQASEKNRHDLLNLLYDAPQQALNPANYDVEPLKAFIGGQTPDSNSIASKDVALTVSLVRYLVDLRQGQVTPRELPSPVHIAPKPALDLPGLLKQHLAAETLPELAGLFEPKSRQYQQLKQILQSMRLSRHQTTLDEFKLSKVLHPGEQHVQIAKLRLRLKAMGELSGSADSQSKVYDEELVALVKKLQLQRGLKADGIIGPSSAELFNPASSEKIMQLELAMERARWLPDSSDSPMIVVNIPAFELWAFKSPDDQNPLNMKVVVGKSPDNQTPLLWEELKYLEFMPYWNIPKTIYDKEIRPKAANDGSYLASHDIELVHHQNSEEQGGGSYVRARQRPGKKNPLGRVKFVFPNTADVYMHDTPSRAAFNRPRRDLSHGCVRVADPEQLAQFVLGDQSGWDKESIKLAMSAPKTHHVTLKRSIPVLFYYATTFVDHENQLRYYPDVYGQDELLKKALSKLQTPSLLKTTQTN